MTQTAQSLSWMLTSDIRVTTLDGYPEGVTVLQLDGAGRKCVIEMSPDGLRFNGERVDVADDYPAYLGIVDAAMESASGTVTISAE